MGPLPEIGTLIVQTLGSLYLLVVVLRFLLQLARADFYNPISQFVVKATSPLVIPIRRVVPGLMGIDLASIVLALLLQVAVLEITALFMGYGLIDPVSAVIWSLVGLLSLVANVYFWGLLITVIVSWVAPHSTNPALMLLRELMEPMMAPIRRVLPDMGGIDISPIFAFLALNVVQVLIKYLAATVGLNGPVSQLVMGI